MIRSKSFILFPLLLTCGVTLCDEPSVDFNRDVRPILSNLCFECHGPDEGTRETDLRLDLPPADGKDVTDFAAIVPGHPDKSELLERITSDDEDLRMPPPEHGDEVTAEQVAVLKTWIAQGAPYAKHWSFEPVRRMEVPVSSKSPKNWRANPVDGFVFRKLEEHGIAPSPEAQKETLVRRVWLDLLGLPPSIDEVDAFVRDDHPKAYERMIDRALKSDRFGERWGRHWLDQARYADSNGYTNDGARSMWPYRDWVINALNEDMPFDQFTIEQIAGDLLPDPTLQQRIATGFHRNTLISGEGGSKADQFRDEQVKDRVDTTGLVWMGLTVGCAKCHTHKFDPITQNEYYELYSFFNSTVDKNSTSPTVKVPSSEQEKELAQIRKRQAEISDRIARDEGRTARQAAWEAKLTAKKGSAAKRTEPVKWTVLDLSGKSDKDSRFKSLRDKSLLVSGKGTSNEEYQSTARSPLTKIRSVRLEVLTDDSLPKKGPGRAGNGNFVLTEFWFQTGDGRQLQFSKASADHSQPDYSIADAIDGKEESGWAINGAPEGSMNRNRTAWFVLPKALEVEDQHALTFKMQFYRNENYGIGRYRISISSDEWVDQPDPGSIATLLSVAKKDRSKEQQKKIDQAFLESDEKLGKLNDELAELAARADEINGQTASTMVMQELSKPRQAYVQVRGDFLRKGEDVSPGVPKVLPPLNSDAGPSRLALARWLVSEDHPLTSRVRVNRIWMRLFGRGLVETENDFGIQGTLPSHPDLLDWLASEFVREGWSTKRLLKLVMASATYRQSSRTRDDLKDIDARNLLLARQSRLRVEAEIVRDIALTVSGRLSDKIGGPSVFPPQPDGVYAFTQRAKKWNISKGEDRYRRGMYTFFYRTAPYPMLSTFDVPKFNTVCTSRDRSNTPLQSLTMANSEALLELAEHLGKRIMDEAGGDTDEDRIRQGYRLCFARPATDKEVERLSGYADQCRKRFADEADVWSAVARVLINLDEFVTRE